MRASRRTSLLLTLVSTLLVFGTASGAAFQVVIDTSGLSGDAVMAFDFDNSDDASHHQLDISDFESDGALYVSATTDPANCPSSVFPFSVDACKDPADTDVTGTLGNGSGNISISDTGATGLLITYYQKIALGSASDPHIAFTFEMSGDANSPDAPFPDGFTFWLLDPNSSSEFGDLLPGTSGPLILYTFDGDCDTSLSEGIATCTQVPSVPEPETFALALAALLALTASRLLGAPFLRRKGLPG